MQLIHPKLFKRALFRRGLSLIEVLATIGMIGIFTLLVSATLSPLLDSTEEAKLADQVSSLNDAVVLYLSNGGTIPANSTAAQVISQLRSKASDSSAERLAGYRGAFVDPRLQPIWQEAGDVDPTQPRAVWRTDKKAFVIITSGHERGIVSFSTDGDPNEIAEEDRRLAMQLSANGGWIWEFNDVGATASLTTPSPELISPTLEMDIDEARYLPYLYAPEITPPTGTYPITDYELTVTFRNPNPPGSSRLVYSIDGGPWLAYEDEPVSATPDSQILAKALSEEPETWQSSPPSAAQYAVSPYQLEAPEIQTTASVFHHLDDPEIEVTLHHLNPSEVSVLEYRLDEEESWTSYDSPFTLSAEDHLEGVAIFARAKATVSHYLDSPVTEAELEGAEPITLEKPEIAFSHPAFDRDVSSIEVTLTNPNAEGSSTIIYHIGPLPGGDGSPTTSQTYSNSFTVAQSVWSDGFGIWAYAKSTSPIYLDSDEANEYASGVAGIFGGHLDLDTATFISPVGNGSNDAHTHDITGKHDLNGIDFFAIPDSKQVEIDEAIGAGTRFKILAINGDLSPGMRVKMRYSHGSTVHEIVQGVAGYDDRSLADLPILSIDGALGSYRLESFEVQFAEDVITEAGVIPTNTGDVKSNIPGRNGEWRNGALTFHVVQVNEDGSNAFTTESSMSAGGLHGVATSGLLWEGLVFWHWKGKSYHESENQYVPGDAQTIEDNLEFQGGKKK